MLRKNPLFTGLLTLVATTVVSILALVPITVNKDVEAMSWMSKVDDNTKITELSIPEHMTLVRLDLFLMYLVNVKILQLKLN
jgi:hypothetical protein